MNVRNLVYRAAALLTALLLAVALLPAPMRVSAAVTASSLQTGDYIKLGTYLDEDILWRMIEEDGTGKLMLAFRVLTVKPFDAKGVDGHNVSKPDGHMIPRETDVGNRRADNGSNLWVNSTLRGWLNSGEDTVTYVGNRPTLSNVNANPYGDEPGFLQSFTPTELAAIRPVTQRAVLGPRDMEMSQGGDTPMASNIGVERDDAPYLEITDRVFLPDAGQIQRLSLTGLTFTPDRNQWWQASFHRGSLSPAAIAQVSAAGADGQMPPDVGLGDYDAVDYWTRDPYGSPGIDNLDAVYIRLAGGGPSHTSVSSTTVGVRPAFYVNEEALIVGGDGSVENPYVLEATPTEEASFELSAAADTTTQIYLPDTLSVTVNASVPGSLTGLFYLLTDPENGPNLTSEAQFNALDPIALPHSGGSAGISVDRNATVWIMAKWGSTTKLTRVTFQNFYTPVTGVQRGVKAEDATPLYLGVALPYSGVAGVPLNSFNGNSVIAGVPYDSISYVSKLAEKAPDMAGLWTTADGGTITLNAAGYTQLQNPVVLEYNKKPGAWADVNIYFVDEGGDPIDVAGTAAGDQPRVRTDFAPIGKSLSDAGLHLPVPAAIDPDYTPYRWEVYDATDTGFEAPRNTGEEVGGSYIGFNPVIHEDGALLRIFYKTEQTLVVERHVILNGDGTHGEKAFEEAISLPNDARYTVSAMPGIPNELKNHVLVGYEINGARHMLEYAGDAWDAVRVWTAADDIDVPVSDNLIVAYLYSADQNGDGIADGDQVTVTARWVGRNPYGSNTILQTETFGVRRFASFTVSNDGASGSDSHIIPTGGTPQWIFDSTMGSAVHSFSEVLFHTAVTFPYDLDSGGTGIPDQDQAVTVRYRVEDGAGNLTNPHTWADTTTGVLTGDPFTMLAPRRTGYVAWGYRLDNDAGTTNFANLDMPALSFTAQKHDHVVTIVYRRLGAPVTFRWVGRSMAGKEFLFGSIERMGIVGESFEMTQAIHDHVSPDVDGATWAHNAAGSPPLPHTVTFGNEPRVVTFRYDEKPDRVTFAVDFVSSDGELNLHYTLEVNENDDPVTVQAIDIPLYTYSRYEVAEFGEVIRQGTDSGVTLNPAEGSMQVLFHYTPNVANVRVNAVERGTGALLSGQVNTGVLIGKKFSANAPHIEGYTLAPGQPLIQTIDVKSSGNLIRFEYERLGSVFIHCVEDLGSGREVILNSIPVTRTGEVAPPDLTGDFFLFDAENEDNDSIPAVVTHQDFVDGRVIRYYYKSEMLGVRIHVVDGTGVALPSPVGDGYPLLLSAVARKGEMYTVTAPMIAGYVLDGEQTQTVYADPAAPDGIVHVTFHYGQPAPGEVTVRHFYPDGGNKVILREHIVGAPAGLPFTASAAQFDGFALNSPAAQTITVNGSGANLIEFEYTDVRKTVLVQTTANGTGAATIQTFKAPAGTEVTVQAPYMPGRSLKSYQIGGAAPVTTGLDNIRFTVQSDVTVTLDYASYVTIQIVGKADDTSGKVLYSIPKRVEYSSSSAKVIADSDIPDLEPNWFMTDPDKPLKQTFAPDSNRAVEFYYTDGMVTLTIEAVLQNGSTPVPGFAPILVRARMGEAFGYNAPYIPGYALADTDQLHQEIASVTADATLTFVYKQALGNVTVLLREDGPGGPLIATRVQTLAHGVPTEIPVPGLPAAAYYTPKSTAQTVTYLGVPLTVEYYYEKDTIPVVRRTYLKGSDTVLSETQMGEYRLGEVAAFLAPGKENHELSDTNPKLKLVAVPPSPGPGRSGQHFEVPFYYVSIAPDTLVVEAVNEAGDILHSYHLTAAAGTSITVNAPQIEGYRLRSSEPAVRTGTVGSKVTFRYAEIGRSADLTIAVTYAQTGLPAEGATVEVTHGGVTETYATPANGQVALTELPHGLYQIAVSHSGYHSATADVTLEGNQSIRFALGRTETTVVGGGDTGSGGPGGGGGAAKTETHTPYLNGYVDATVRPEGLITRSEAAAIFYRLLDADIRTAAEPAPFPDVAGDAWYSDAVGCLAGLGILKGGSDGTFRPEAQMTRAEFAAVAARFHGSGPKDGTAFADAAGHWAEGYIMAAYANGWVSGYPDGTFRPEGHISRAEVVKILNVMLGRNTLAGDISQELYGMYSDLEVTHWAFAHIIEASVMHTFVRRADGYETWVTFE